MKNDVIVEERKDKIIVVGEPDTVAGFRLAGVAVSFLATPANSDSVVMDALATKDAGILIISDEIAASLSHKGRKALSSSTKPVVVTVPSRNAKQAPGGSIAELVKRAIGVELK